MRHPKYDESRTIDFSRRTDSDRSEILAITSLPTLIETHYGDVFY